MVHNRLANQHSVERIFMHKRQPAQMQSSFFVELQRFNAMLLALERDKTSWRFRERQLAQSIFDGDLPRRDGTQVDFISRIGEYFASLF